MMILRLEEPAFEDDWIWDTVMEVPKLVCMLKTNPLAQRDRITYEDLRTQRFVMNPPTVMPMHYRFINEQTRKHGGFEPLVARFSKTPHDLIGSLEQDDEVVVCDMYLRDIDSEFIRCFELPGTFSGLDAVRRKDNKNPDIPRFLELAKQCLAEAMPDNIPVRE